MAVILLTVIADGTWDPWNQRNRKVRVEVICSGCPSETNGGGRYLRFPSARSNVVPHADTQRTDHSKFAVGSVARARAGALAHVETVPPGRRLRHRDDHES